MNLHRPLEGAVKTVTIKHEAGRWFACFSVERVAASLPESDLATGIDVGLNCFAVLTDGTKIQNPRHYRNAQARLRRCQRKVARRRKGGNRRRKAVLLQRANIHFQHKLSRQLVNEYGTIAVENLNVKDLAGGVLAKSVHDEGWLMFVAILVYKAESVGRQVIQVDPRGTCQTCLCGARVAKTLADRWHDCPACGLSAGRDHVSAQATVVHCYGKIPAQQRS